MHFIYPGAVHHHQHAQQQQPYLGSTATSVVGVNSPIGSAAAAAAGKQIEGLLMLIEKLGHF